MTELRTASGNTTFTPWTDGFAVGFAVCNEETGKMRYVYLNPSLDDGSEEAGDAGTLFLYNSPPEAVSFDSSPLCYVDALVD